MMKIFKRMGRAFRRAGVRFNFTGGANASDRWAMFAVFAGVPLLPAGAAAFFFPVPALVVYSVILLWVTKFVLRNMILTSSQLAGIYDPAEMAYRELFDICTRGPLADELITQRTLAASTKLSKSVLSSFRTLSRQARARRHSGLDEEVLKEWTGQCQEIINAKNAMLTLAQEKAEFIGAQARTSGSIHAGKVLRSELADVLSEAKTVSETLRSGRKELESFLKDQDSPEMLRSTNLSEGPLVKEYH